jgi:hypothetical protein
MQIAAIAMLVAFVTLTNTSANSEPAAAGSAVEPTVEAVVSIEAAVGEAASAVSAAADAVGESANAGSVAGSLDVLEQPSDVTRPLTASMPEICAELQAAATDHSLPVAFFARLIWQ